LIKCYKSSSNQGGFINTMHTIDLDGDGDIYLSARVKWRCNTHDALMYFKNNTLQ